MPVHSGLTGLCVFLGACEPFHASVLVFNTVLPCQSPPHAGSCQSSCSGEGSPPATKGITLLCENLLLGHLTHETVSSETRLDQTGLGEPLSAEKKWQGSWREVWGLHWYECPKQEAWGPGRFRRVHGGLLERLKCLLLAPSPQG